MWSVKKVRSTAPDSSPFKKMAKPTPFAAWPPEYDTANWVQP